MTNPYYDQYGMLRPKKNENGENDIVFIAYEDTYRPIGKERAHLILFAHINSGGYIRQSPWDDRLASHDNITAFLYLVKKYKFNYSLKFKQVLAKFWHPRDLLFLAGVKNNPFLLFNLNPHPKWRPGSFGQKLIRKFYTYQHTVPMFSGYQEYYTTPDTKFPLFYKLLETFFIDKANGQVLIQYSNDTLDGKLLNLLRFRTNESDNASITLRLADKLSIKNYGNDDYLRTWFRDYFGGDEDHPIIQFGKISGQNYLKE